jgi:hypothetical protein
MPDEAPPTLDHGIPDPETFLPETPVWFWWVLGTGAIVVLILLVTSIRLLRPKADQPVLPKRDLFAPAMDALETLNEQCGRGLLSAVAAQASLALRMYLADARSEPALYETAEEFEARQTVLPQAVNSFLNELNEAKYAESSISEEKSRDLVARAQACLRKLHAAVPPDEVIAPPVQPSPHQKFRDHILALAPFGFAVVLSLFLIELYDGRDTGMEIDVNVVTWIALGLGGLGLLLHFIFRSAR